MTRESATKQVHDVDVSESLEYLEEKGYSSNSELERADRAILVETPDIVSDEVQLRYLESGENSPFETVELEDRDKDYEVLLE